MRRQFVVGFLVLALSAAAVASAGAVGRADGRSCTTQRFAAVIQALGTDGVAFRRSTDRAVTFRLLARTQIRRQDRPVPVTALAVGQKVLVEVRTCQGGGGPAAEVAVVSIRVVGPAGEPTGDGTPRSSEPGATGTGCGVRAG